MEQTVNTDKGEYLFCNNGDMSVDTLKYKLLPYTHLGCFNVDLRESHLPNDSHLTNYH